MSTKFSLLLLLYIFIISMSFQSEFEYEIIKELIPYNILFTIHQNNQYKIFQYIPSCNEANTSLKTIYAQSTTFEGFILYVYDDFSKIELTKKYQFKNSILRVSLSHKIIEIPDLSCGKEYYFIISIITLKKFEKFCQFSIMSKELNNTIDISSLSQNLTFYQRTDNEEKFYYSSNETKYALIQVFFHSKLKIVEINETNDENVIIDKQVNFFSKIFEFKKNKKYYIYYSLINNQHKTPIIFQLYNNSDYNIYNFNKDGPLILGTNNYVYNFEIDASDYNIGDYIVLILGSFYGCISLKYQYKNSLKSNHYINVGEYYNFNFIPIKKTVEDSSIIINLNLSSPFPDESQIFTVIDLFKYDFEEITSEYNKLIKGPKLFYIEDFKFDNNFNSYGI